LESLYHQKNKGSLVVCVASPKYGGDNWQKSGDCMTNHQGLKSRNLITFPLDIPEVEVIRVEINERGDYIVTVESTCNRAVCQSCGHQITKSNGYGREIELRHLPILGHRLYIRLRPKRYECPNCNGKTSTQELDWYDPKSPHTKAYDRHLMLQLVNSTVEDVRRCCPSFLRKP
jgi:transposase